MDLRIKLTNKQRKAINNNLKTSETEGNLQQIKRFLCLLSLDSETSLKSISHTLRVGIESIQEWIKKYLVFGVKGLLNKRKPGRPCKLTKKQRKELSNLIKKGPSALGFSGSCWRTPMIQSLIYERYNISYNVKYLSELLQNMGFSFQKAKFVASKQDKEKRQEWLENKWPEILSEAEKTNSYLLFGDECSFPQWGTLSYTWAPIGKQPIIKTSGKRKGYKVFGVIDYFTGRFFSKGVEGKLNGKEYIDFLKGILKKTRKPIVLIRPYLRFKPPPFRRVAFS